jgi:DOPA 4,5-dioxygenase
MNIQDYHFHLYYEVKDIEKAISLKDKIVKEFNFQAGRVWDKPVGPHPIGSCQISVPNESFYDAITWLFCNRDGIDFFIHPNSGDALADHSRNAVWLGKSYELNLKMFE